MAMLQNASRLPHRMNPTHPPEQALAFFSQLWLRAPDPFWLCEVRGADFVFTALNPAEQAIDPRFRPGVTLRAIVGEGHDADELISGYRICCETGEPHLFDQRPVICGEECLFQTLLVPVTNADGMVTHIWGYSRNLTAHLRDQRALEQLNRELEQRVRDRTEELLQANLALTKSNQALADLAATDPLTGLLNRRQFFLSGDAEYSRAKRHSQHLVLIMLDLDHFKRVNDDFGHACGDQLLQRVAGVFRHSMRHHDLIARMGGEEFALLLPQTDLAAAAVHAQRLRELIAQISALEPVAEATAPVSVTASLGVAELGPLDQNLSELLHRADVACYRAKGAGRNRVEVG